ncbi:MAG: hypothetical protein IT423_03020 [Pirellulaceae bacterium]|nr:hypothetical protein [Pirellulaceae bacterium]
MTLLAVLSATTLCLLCLGNAPLIAQIAVPAPDGLQSVVPIQNSGGNTAAQRHLSQADQAAIILKSALLSGVWGPPAHCAIRKEIEILGRTIRGTGKYARGSVGEMKLALKVVAGNHQNSLDQVSDGRTLRVLYRLDGKEDGSHIDLVRVSEYLGRFTEQDRTDPLVALHLAIGGQNEKLRALCQQYKWTSVTGGKYTQPGHTETTDVWWLEGHRSFDEPVLRGTAKIDAMLASADSAQLAPNLVSLAIGRGGPMPFWLYHVKETRQVKEKTVGSHEFVVKMDYYDPTLAEMPPGMFNAEDYASSAGTDVDETPKYTPPNRDPSAYTAARP